MAEPVFTGPAVWHLPIDACDNFNDRIFLAIQAAPFFVEYLNRARGDAGKRMNYPGHFEEPMAQQNPPGLRRCSAALHEYVIAIVLTGFVTVLSWSVEPFAGHAAASSLYLLMVVAAGLRLSRGPVLVAAALSTLAWYTVFIPPRFAFHIGTVEDAMIFASFFAVAMAMGHLTSQLRIKELSERTKEQHTAALYQLVRQAGLAPDLECGLKAAIGLVEAVFGVRASLLLRRSDHSLATEVHPASSCPLSQEDHRLAEWAFSKGAVSGKFTDNSFPEGRAMHLPLQGRTAVMGVLSIHVSSDRVLDSAERELLDAFAVLIAAVLEKDELLQGSKCAEILAASERLQRALLQSVSHELKTPLAAVRAGMDALRREISSGSRSERALAESRQALYRLNRVINNLLDMTRIEAGAVLPKLDWCDLGDLVQAAIDVAGDSIANHTIASQSEEELPLVRVDQRLLEPCLANLLLNAAASSPPGSTIEIVARVASGRLLLSVRDEGKGIPVADLRRIFRAFQRGSEASQSGTGLGLAVVEGFVQAHGGSVTAANRPSKGAEFVMTIPVETLQPQLLERLA